MCSLDKVKATFNSLQVLKNILLREWCQLKWQNAAAAAAKSLQSCLTLCDPRDGSPPGSPVPGILQARTLEWKWQNRDPQKIISSLKTMRQFTKKKKNGQKQTFRTLEINQRLAAILENLIHTHPHPHTQTHGKIQ